MRIIDDEVKPEKKIKAGKPIDRTAQALNNLARAVADLKATEPPPKDTAMLDALHEISDRMQKLTEQVAVKRKPSKWTFEVVRNQLGVIVSVEAIKK